MYRTRKRYKAQALAGLLLPALLLAGISAAAQKTTSPPPTDAAAQSSPLQPTPKVPAVDAAVQSSPITEPHSSGICIAPHTAIPIALSNAIDSGKVKNGQTIPAKLTTAVQAHGKNLPAGTPVGITVVATVPAGKLNAVGEFSLQLESVGGIHAYTDTQTFRGKPGHRDVADAAPTLGTDAGLASGAALTFHVLPPPTEATGPPPNVQNTPGRVNGVAPGSPPPAGSSPRQAAEENPGNTSTTITQPNTTSHPIAGAQPQ